MANAIPWLGLAAILAIAVVSLFLINRVVPASDGCTSDLIAQSKGLDLDIGLERFKGKAKVSPAAQRILSEKLQNYAQSTSLLCRMNAKGALSDEEYSLRVKQLTGEMDILKNAARSGKLATASNTDVSRLVLETLSEESLGPYIIFFDWSRSRLSIEAQSVLAAAAKRCRQVTADGGNLVMTVNGVGLTDPAPAFAEGRSSSGDSFAESREMPVNRLISVVQEIKKMGCVVPATVHVEWLPRPANDGGVREIAYRRVEIRFAPAII